MSTVPTVTGDGGFQMPILGLGTWQIHSTDGGADLEKTLESALEAGYRLIDTASVYMNEDIIGNVLRKWLDAGKLKREDLFIVTKLPLIANRPERVEKFLNLSLEKLQLDYIDLYLIHGPFGLNYHNDENMIPTRADGTADLDMETDIVAVWRKMEEQVAAGRTKSIGVSNFNSNQIDRLLAAGCTKPAVNQIQLNAYFQQPEMVKYLQERDIVIMSYSTLGAPGLPNFYKDLGITVDLANILKNKIVESIADEVARTPAQVLLRHMIQKNIVVIPKSSSPSRMRENFAVLDFELNDRQMGEIDALDQNHAILDFKHFLIGVENHPEYPYA